MGPQMIALTAGGVVVSGFVAWSLLWWYEGERCEKPKYTLEKVLLKQSTKLRLRSYNEIEVRLYDPFVIAEATVSCESMRKASSKGFMTVARYIFGENKKKGSSEVNEVVAMTAPVRMEVPNAMIAMTAPVQMRQVGEDVATADNGSDEQTYKVSFVMPSSYSLETLPVPNNAELSLKQVPAHRVAVYTYFGNAPSPKRLAGLAQSLRETVEEAGLKIEGTTKPSVYQYHPPFAPPFLRRVEVLYKLA